MVYRAGGRLAAAAAFAAAALIVPASGRAHSLVSCGTAAWYQLTGRTASGERANPEGMVAAHRTLPLGTKVQVTNLRNNRRVVVRIYDRGPYTKGRIIDVSRGVARELGFMRRGLARVRIAVVGPDGTPAKGSCR